MYICICNALTDRKIKQAMADAGSATPGEIHAACGCRAQCGNCVRRMRDMLREHFQPAKVEFTGAD